MVREGIRALLERHGFEVAAEADDVDSAVRLAGVHSPDVAILDLAVPPAALVGCARAILATNAKVGIVLLATHASEDQVMASLRAGVRGYVVKTQSTAELVQAIREVSAGRTYLSDEAAAIVAHLCFGGVSALESLTPRLREVLRLVAEGKSTREIAPIIGVSEKTAELYRSRIMTKLDLHDTAGLVRFAIQHGFVQL